MGLGNAQGPEFLPPTLCPLQPEYCLLPHSKRKVRADRQVEALGFSGEVCGWSWETKHQSTTACYDDLLFYMVKYLMFTKFFLSIFVATFIQTLSCIYHTEQLHIIYHVKWDYDNLFKVSLQKTWGHMNLLHTDKYHGLTYIMIWWCVLGCTKPWPYSV